MAKTMAKIENGVVVNLEWHNDNTPDTATLISSGERPVAIGDTYTEGFFYHDGEKVLSEKEQLQAQNAELQALIDELYTEVTS